MRVLLLSLVFLCSLLLRIWLTPKLDFGVDQQAIFEIGKTFFETGIIPAEGPRLVYTGETIPGGFQAVMAGLPLFFSQGERIGLQVWVGVLNWLSMLLMFLWFRKKVEARKELVLAAFLAFSPWSLLFSPAWNPSFLPVLSVPFFWLLERAADSSKKNEPYPAWIPFLIGLLAILCFQLHLSAVLLGIAVLLVLPAIGKPLRFIGMAALGKLIGGLFLIPWVLKKMDGSVAAPTGVVGFHFENAADIVKAFFRYVSFSTAEVARFISPQGHGLGGMLSVLNSHPWIWIFAGVAYLGTLILCWNFLRRWWSLRHGRCAWERMEFYLPLLMPLTFLFSVKGASAHTFWILVPVSFYSMVMAARNLPLVFCWTYTVSALVFTLAGYLAGH